MFIRRCPHRNAHTGTWTRFSLVTLARGALPASTLGGTETRTDASTCRSGGGCPPKHPPSFSSTCEHGAMAGPGTRGVTLSEGRKVCVCVCVWGRGGKARKPEKLWRREAGVTAFQNCHQVADFLTGRLGSRQVREGLSPVPRIHSISHDTAGRISVLNSVNSLAVPGASITGTTAPSPPKGPRAAVGPPLHTEIKETPCRQD